jgi:hypothetical protein
MLSEQQSQRINDITRLVTPPDRGAYLSMLEHRLRGREVDDHELRRVAEQTWREFLQDGWPRPPHSATNTLA